MSYSHILCWSSSFPTDSYLPAEICIGMFHQITPLSNTCPIQLKNKWSLNAVFSFILLLILVQSLFLELKKTLLFNRRICFSSPVFCIVQHTRPHVIINHTYIHTGLRTNKHHFIHLFMPSLLVILVLLCFGYAWSICWKIKSWQRCLSTLMIRLLLLRWKRVAASMDIHIKDPLDLAPTRTPAQLQPAPGLVSYMFCCRLLETTNYSNIFLRIAEKTPQKTIKRLSHD